MATVNICRPSFAAENDAARSELTAAVDWLVQQQGKSGAWKSETYGAMRQGAATTSLSLYALSHLPESLREKHENSIEKAIAFLQPGIAAKGCVANPDGSLDQPVYGTALYLIAIDRLQHVSEAKQIETLLLYLVGSQCTQQRGFAPDDPNFGGWDIIGPNVAPGKTSGTNVSISRYVVEALTQFVAEDSLTRRPLDVAVLQRVRESIRVASPWLLRLQAISPDGGFIFSPQPETALNKSLNRDGEPQSYGSATCDGFLMLRFFDVANEAGLDRASRWLQQNSTLERVPGFDAADFDSGWAQSLKFYYMQTLALVLDEFEDAEFENEDWSERLKLTLKVELKNLQQSDGHFANPSALMREDDPLIATAFAIVALSQLD